MAKISNWTRVAVEGATSDGRVIERNWLTEAAANYNPATYAARVNLEHIRGVTADKPFWALGDVVALKTQEDDIELAGKTTKKTALYAQIRPNDDLLAMNSGGQKLYTSIEIAPQFADSKKAYLVGLAVTDSPASLGTQVLAFAAGAGAANPFANKKQHADNLIVEATEATFTFTEETPPADDQVKSLFAAAMEYFKPKPKDEPKPDPKPEPANDNDARFTAFSEGLVKIQEAVQTGFNGLRTELSTLKTKVDTLEGTVDTTAATSTFNRQPTGGGGGTGLIAGMDW